MKKGTTKPDSQMKARYRKMRVNGKQVSVHRYIAEQAIGRSLLSSEVVHHINGNKLDNHPENLCVLTASEHSILENTGKKLTEEHKRKIGLASKGNHYRRGKTMPQDVRDKISESMKNARAKIFWSTRKKPE